MNTNAYVDYIINLEVRSCATVTITPSTISNIIYLVKPTTLSITYSFTAFTSSSSLCGSISYNLMLRDSSVTPATNSALTTPPFTYTAGSLSMIISTNSAANGIQELELFGAYPSTPSTQVSSIFTVEFTSDCLNSQVFGPSPITYTVTVNALSPSPVLLTGFTTDI